MSCENPNNIIFKCAKHSSRPKARFQLMKPHEFIGRHVKRCFVGVSDSEGHQLREHMWVKVTGVKDSKTLIGTLDNDPVFPVGVKNGDEVLVELRVIEELL